MNNGLFAFLVVCLLSNVGAVSLDAFNYSVSYSPDSSSVSAYILCLPLDDFRGDVFDVALVGGSGIEFMNVDALQSDILFSPNQDTIILHASVAGLNNLSLCVRDSCSRTFYGKCALVWSRELEELKQSAEFNLTSLIDSAIGEIPGINHKNISNLSLNNESGKNLSKIDALRKKVDVDLGLSLVFNILVACFFVICFIGFVRIRSRSFGLVRSLSGVGFIVFLVCYMGVWWMIWGVVGG